MLKGLSFALLLNLLASPATAQQSEPPSDEIVIVGQRNTEAIQAFVADVAATNQGDQLARWDRRICPGVAGLRARYAQFVIDRMAQRAFDVGLDVGEPSCRANVLIVVTLDPDAAARELFENNRDAMGWFYERGQRTQGRRALREFVDSDAPVRWWHVSRVVTRDGESVGETADGSAAVNRVTGNSSRLNRTTRQDFGAAFVIVDARRLQGVSFEALADYLAMVTLAQLDSDADTSGFPTILNLFSTEDRIEAMTDWDLGYLRGLYGAARDAASAARQEGEIAREIEQNLSEE